MIVDLDKIADNCHCKAVKHNWIGDPAWSHRGCYLHLEVSEFIESLRGKGLSTPDKEAADVLFVLLSLVRSYNIPITDVISQLEEMTNGYS